MGVSLLKQSGHIDRAFFHVRAQEYPANMGRRAKIYFIIMFGFLLVDHDSMVDDAFCKIVGNELCPYFLFDKVWLIGMKITQSDGIF